MKKTVSNTLAKDFLALLKGSGIDDTQRLMDICGISQYELDKSNVRISGRAHFKLIREVSNHSKSIREAIKSSHNEYDILNSMYLSFPEFIGYTLNQESVPNAIMAYIENRFIIGDCDDISVIHNDDKIKLTYVNEGPVINNDISAIGNFLLLYKIVSQYSLNKSIEIGCTGAHSDDYDFINDSFETKCKFGSKENFIIINTKTGEDDASHYNYQLNLLQKKLLDTKRAEIYGKTTFEDIVAGIIEKSVHKYGMIGSDSSIMDNVCSLMTMSRWTLNERLKEEGTSFSELLRSIKLKISCNLLVNSSKSIQEISELVCFSSISSFSRFFTTNLNISPLSYRKSLSKND